jgi:5-(carboxyamino)imidazole ribonucleotide synthase
VWSGCWRSTFETVDDRLVVNELAMRPHNFGSLDGARTGQFEQHLARCWTIRWATPRRSRRLP